MFKNLVFAVIISSCLLSAPVSAQSNVSDLDKAQAALMDGKFAEAEKIYVRAISGKEKSNPMAHYFYALCLWQMGKTAESKAEYKRCLELNPPATIASYCHRQLGTQPTRQASTGTPGSPAVRSNIKSPQSAAAQPASKQPVELDPRDASFVTVHRQTPDTNSIKSTVLAALAVVPKKVKDDIREAGCSILICPTINEANPHLKNEKPAGYIHGGGYDNCPGMFYSGTKILYIAERAQYNNSPPQLNWAAASTTLHELGHAYDFAKSHVSSGGEFEKLYKQDYERLTNSDRTRWNYYCQENGGERGRSELFAELFAITHGTAGGIDERSGDLAKVFPHCYQYMSTLGH